MILAVLATAGCRNVPAEEREAMRREVETVAPENRDALRARLRTNLLGQGQTRPAVDPHLRASAAQGLGNLADPDDTEPLLDALAGPLADENLMVRMECAIALGKLRFDRADPRRETVTRRLRDRLVFERDETGRLYEREFLVRVAMVNSLIQVGTRLGASALHDVASRLAADLDGDRGEPGVDASDKGLLDRVLAGLARLCNVPPEEAARHRAQSDELAPHLAWWAVRIARLPES